MKTNSITLHHKRRELDALFNRMQEASAQAWQELQRDFQATFKAILNTLEETERLLEG